MLDAKARFLGDGNDTILTGHHKLLWPSIGRVNVWSSGGVVFWERCIKRMKPLGGCSCPYHLYEGPPHANKEDETRSCYGSKEWKEGEGPGAGYGDLERRRRRFLPSS